MNPVQLDLRINPHGTVIITEHKPWLLGFSRWEEHRVESVAPGHTAVPQLRGGRWRWCGFGAKYREVRYPPTGVRAELQPRPAAGGGGWNLVETLKAISAAAAIYEDVLNVRRGELAAREAEARDRDARRFWSHCLRERERGRLNWEEEEASWQRFMGLLHKHGMGLWREARTAC